MVAVRPDVLRQYAGTCLPLVGVFGEICREAARVEAGGKLPCNALAARNDARPDEGFERGRGAGHETYAKGGCDVSNTRGKLASLSWRRGNDACPKKLWGQVSFEAPSGGEGHDARREAEPRTRFEEPAEDVGGVILAEKWVEAPADPFGLAAEFRNEAGEKAEYFVGGRYSRLEVRPAEAGECQVDEGVFDEAEHIPEGPWPEEGFRETGPEEHRMDRSAKAPETLGEPGSVPSGQVGAPGGGKDPRGRLLSRDSAVASHLAVVAHEDSKSSEFGVLKCDWFRS